MGSEVDKDDPKPTLDAENIDPLVVSDETKGKDPDVKLKAADATTKTRLAARPSDLGSVLDSDVDSVATSLTDTTSGTRKGKGKAKRSSKKKAQEDEVREHCHQRQGPTADMIVQQWQRLAKKEIEDAKQFFEQIDKDTSLFEVEFV